MLGYNGGKIRMIFYIQVSALFVVCVMENRFFQQPLWILQTLKNPSNKTDRYVFFLGKKLDFCLKITIFAMFTCELFACMILS